MATLRVHVLIGTAVLPDTEANRRRMFVFGGAAGTGNIRTRNNTHDGEGAYNWNNPAVPGGISVTSYSPVYFDSNNFYEKPGLQEQVISGIEKGYITVVDMADPGTALDRAAIEAFNQ